MKILLNGYFVKGLDLYHKFKVIALCIITILTKVDNSRVQLNGFVQNKTPSNNTSNSLTEHYEKSMQHYQLSNSTNLFKLIFLKSHCRHMTWLDIQECYNEFSIKLTHIFIFMTVYPFCCTLHYSLNNSTNVTSIYVLVSSLQVDLWEFPAIAFTYVFSNETISTYLSLYVWPVVSSFPAEIQWMINTKQTLSSVCKAMND